jgi:hypothetical protein
LAVVGEELCSLFGFGVSVRRVSSQPFVAWPVNVRVSGHGFVRARERWGGSEEKEEDETDAGRASGLYPRL